LKNNFFEEKVATSWNLYCASGLPLEWFWQIFATFRLRLKQIKNHWSNFDQTWWKDAKLQNLEINIIANFSVKLCFKQDLRGWGTWQTLGSPCRRRCRPSPMGLATTWSTCQRSYTPNGPFSGPKLNK
jgi:hypothetical protein